VKTYSLDNGVLDLIDERSILFKDGFVKGQGVSPENLEKLFSYFSELSGRLGLSAENAEIYATGIWREIPEAQAELTRRKIRDSANGVLFGIISHADEARYLKQAADMDFGGKKVMVVNMGGKTTEIVSAGEGESGAKLLNVGVAELLNRFPSVNAPVSGASPGEMEGFVREKLEGVDFDRDYDFALFTGELRFEKLSGYPLSANKMFDDANHPFMLSLDDFVRGTNRIFYDLTMDELRALMPKNPDWMTGARPGAILPLAVFRKAGIKIIVPSDINLVNGVIKGRIP
jgi:hypothetical protein